MDYLQFFRDEYLTEQDLVAFATTLKLCQDGIGLSPCWCLKKLDHPGLKHFSTSHRFRPQFKGRDARLLALALVNQFMPEEGAVVVRKHTCQSQHCINPSHYYFGTLKDVKLEHAKRKGININPAIVTEIRSKRESDKTMWTYQKLGKLYKLPYHVIRRICTENAYANG